MIYERESTSKQQFPVTNVHTFQFHWATYTMTNYATAVRIFFSAALRYVTICYPTRFTINSFRRIQVCFNFCC